MNALFDLTGKTALVTGASGLLGGHFCRVLTQAGARVVPAARRIDALGPGALRLDVTDEASIAECLDAAGPLDILVNNAGAAWGEPFDTFPEKGWD
ncbi:MAG: SDR family NAD(P)-dependent oxidoreductase, partial [Rubritepida sp.]|nr:SDR family NAD(P)-dependent oxidoreductase [Rubritepida sp.]